MQQKEPSSGFMLELLGMFGFLGLGHIWAGRALRGILLMIGYWLVLLFMTVLPVLGLLAANFAGSVSGDVFAGCLVLACSYVLVPISSGVWLRNELRSQQQHLAVRIAPAVPQAPTTTPTMPQPSYYAESSPQYTPPLPVAQSPLTYQPHFQSQYTPTSTLTTREQMVPQARKPAVGLLEILLLYAGPIVFMVGVALGAYRQYSDGRVEHFSTLWPLGMPLEFLGIGSLLIFAGLAVFRKHI